MEKGKLTKLNF
ncbi:hypothetical protein F383_07779 [Gossypium arboreum]|uniref:Uncharacterized protein n=1 Tax=Gossypium arboreum TaxID=29729 RepID=A0A0B0PIQ1_GOSAR|nr:hypothetical protein F383_07779 [Gossypium arboreum]